MNEKELRQKFVDQAVAYVGVIEGSSQHKYIVDTYNKIVPLPQSYKLKYTDSWCAAFVSVIAKKCGLLDIIPAECSCQRQITLWQKLGRWQENDSYTPKVGDIIYYDWGDNGVGDNKGVSDHVGIVVSVSNNVIKVIEGNYKDSVAYRFIDVNGKFVRGYGLPNFASRATSKEIISTSSKESVCNVELKVLKKGNKGQSVKALQALLIGFGYSCGAAGIDGDFGVATENSVKKYQSKKCLQVDGIVGTATWTSLLK